MNSVLFLFASTDGVGAGVGTFILMTAASISLLWILPPGGRRHMSKVGTYAHEVSHGFVSLLTGGHFHRFYVADGGGLCVTSGGNRKAVVAAGYIGTIVLGALCAARSVHGDSLVALQVLAILLALATLKAGDLQTVAVGLGVAGMLSLVGAFLPGAVVARFLLNLMGVVLIWQGFEALKILCLISATTTGSGSDAEVMAHLAGRSPMHWAVVFGGIALVACLLIIGMAVHAAAGI